MFVRCWVVAGDATFNTCMDAFIALCGGHDVCEAEFTGQLCQIAK
jgi:hypothetical protein